jgi:PfaD family protein
MFELGAKVQILKRGTMFGVRASKLYEIYNKYSSLESIPSELRARLEKDYFRTSIERITEETIRFWEGRNPDQARKAERDPKHRMALVFRWYLGQASRWAINGEPSRKIDYQIWCGPAMGAFNDWTANTFLAEPENRTVAQIALNLLEGAAAITRAQQLRFHGIGLPQSAFHFDPRPLPQPAPRS